MRFLPLLFLLSSCSTTQLKACIDPTFAPTPEYCDQSPYNHCNQDAYFVVQCNTLHFYLDFWKMPMLDSKRTCGGANWGKPIQGWTKTLASPQPG